MRSLIADAWAQGASAPSGLGWVEFIPLILLFVVFYYLLIRPQMKRAKEHKQMVEALNKGDEVVTNGGLLGCILDVGDHFIVLEVAKGIEVKVQKSAVAATVPKGTTKTL
ncbi:MAG: preprotein translocase subunit YajC [Gammaproteobacteria bacterium]|nr:preprotein translocase subunit YajC [Gammaproteobacteria bacterium]